MQRQTDRPRMLFHVKQLTLAALAPILATALGACQAEPIQDDPEPSLNTEALKEIVLAVPLEGMMEQQEPAEEPLAELPTPEEAQEATGIASDDAGVAYVDGEVLVTLKRMTSLDDINQELALCDFIQESELDEGMMIVGQIIDGRIAKGASGDAVVLLHTAEGVQVNQAIAALAKMRALKNASPNYIAVALTQGDGEAELGISGEEDPLNQEGSA